MTLQLDTGAPTSEQQTPDPPLVLGVDRVLVGKDGRVQIAVGDGPGIRRDLGRGAVIVAPDRHSLVFRDASTGEIRLIRDRGRPDAILRPGGSGMSDQLSAVWPSPDRVIVSSGRVVAADVDEGTIIRRFDEFGRAAALDYADGGTVVVSRRSGDGYRRDLWLVTGVGR